MPDPRSRSVGTLVFDLSMDILINDIECQEVDLEMNEETIEPMEHQAKVEIYFTSLIGLYNLSETRNEVDITNY